MCLWAVNLDLERKKRQMAGAGAGFRQFKYEGMKQFILFWNEKQIFFCLLSPLTRDAICTRKYASFTPFI